MPKIKLILADPDGGYVDRVADYINASYSMQIKLSTFTRADLLDTYLNNNSCRTDILLAHPAFLEQLAGRRPEAEVVLALSDGGPRGQTGEYEQVSKYQPGDRLVGQILNIYAEKTARIIDLAVGSAKTKIVAVYSPVGGVGKTSVALGLGGALAGLGRSVLALSFETLCPPVLGWSETGNGGLSELLISWLEKSGSLALKLENLKIRHPLYNIDFLEPAGCFMEFADLDSELIGDFINGLKGAGTYDFIIIDMDSKADEKTTAVLGNSDSIVFVQTGDLICRSKTEEFFKHLGRIDPELKTRLTARVVTAVNKHSRSEVCSSVIEGVANTIYLPYISSLWDYNDIYGRFVINPAFIESLRDLAGIIAGPGQRGD